MQEARGEDDGEGDPGHGTPAAATGHQALQPRPPRLPAAACCCFHLQWQRCRQVARVLFLVLHLYCIPRGTSLLLCYCVYKILCSWVLFRLFVFYPAGLEIETVHIVVFSKM